MIIDSAEVLYALLMTATELVTDVTDSEDAINIYGPPGLPEDFTIRKAVMFLCDGGAGDPNTPILRENYSLYCYGRDASEARQVYRQLVTFLHRKRHTRVTLNDTTYLFQYAQLQVGPIDRYEPLEEWPFIYAAFDIHFIEVQLP